MSAKLIDDHQPIAEINIIPFVDIILVILIIFMVTAPFIIKTGFSLDLPKASSAGAQTQSTINVTIVEDGRVLLNGEVLSLEQLKSTLLEQKEPLSEAQALISADKNVLHGKVMTVINALKTIGLKKVAIAAKKPAE